MLQRATDGRGRVIKGGDRRDTSLAQELITEIRESGPIGVDAFMQRCLSDPKHGYYATRSGIGRDGDFTTAPEISQVFGELIGLWAAVVWQQMGSPERINLVELGPGRGVLMDDAIRAARVLPGFLDAAELHLCEINPAFRKLQAMRLAGHPLAPVWHENWPMLAPVPTIAIGNEFLDTIGATQWLRDEHGNWHEIRVGVDAGGELTFVKQQQSPPPAAQDLPEAQPGAIFTHSDFRDFTSKLASIAEQAPFAGLFVDYGHTETTWGDTLQAVRNHQAEHPLTSPGEADLSLAVDFAAVKTAILRQGLTSTGPVTQAEFLGQLGIAERASMLMTANPTEANDIESGVCRLMAAPGMGTRFHAIGACSPGLAPLPGFRGGNE